jgi:hypothetical protein
VETTDISATNQRIRLRRGLSGYVSVISLPGYEGEHGRAVSWLRRKAWEPVGALSNTSKFDRRHHYYTIASASYSELEASFDSAEPREFGGPAKPMSGVRRIISSPLIAAMLWIIASLVAIPNIQTLSARSTRWDFSHYYLSALSLRLGANPYRTNFRQLGRALGLEVGSIDHATYPPTFLLCFEPLVFLTPPAAYRVWMSISAVALIAALWLLIVEAKLPYRFVPAATALVFLYSPLWNHVKFAQCQILILLLIAILFRGLRKGKPWIAGSALATAILLRICPASFLGYLLVRREWRTLGSTLIVGTISAAITLILVGFQTSLSFLGAIGFLTGSQWLDRPTNVALPAVISQLFVFLFGTHLSLGLNMSRIMIEASSIIAVLSTTATVTQVSSDRSPDPEWRAASLWVVTMILVAPTAWMHYMVLLYFPFFMVLGSAVRGTTGPRAVWASIASYLGTSFLLGGTIDFGAHSGAERSGVSAHRGPGCLLR